MLVVAACVAQYREGRPKEHTTTVGVSPDVIPKRSPRVRNAAPEIPVMKTTLGGGVACGVVMDAGTNAPVKGAVISVASGTLEGAAREKREGGVRHAQTDEQGFWSLSDVARGQELPLSVTAEGYTSARGVVRGHPTCERRTPTTLQAGGVRLVGTVHDALGGVVADATVQLKSRGRAEPAAFLQAPIVALSDEDGMYRFSVAPGSYGVTTVAQGYATRRGLVEVADEETEYDVHLLPSGRIEGVDLDESTGATVAGARVYLAKAGRTPLAGTGGDAVSDGEGRFVLEGVAPGNHGLFASLGHRGTPNSVDISLALGELLDGVELRIAEQLYISGRVLDTAGTPAAGVSVMAAGKSSQGVSPTTGPDGEYFIGPLAPGDYLVNLLQSKSNVSDVGVANVSLRDRPATDVDLELHTRVTIRGTVEGGGASTRVDLEIDPQGVAPAEFTRVLGNSLLTTRCHGDGSFEIHDVVPGRMRVVATDPSGGSDSQTIDVAAEGETVVTLVLASQSEVSVTVVDEVGDPVPDVLLTFAQQDAFPVIRGGEVSMGPRIKTNAYGKGTNASFEAGSYTVGASLRGANVEIQEGGTVTIAPGVNELRIGIQSGLGDIYLQVVDGAGHPREGVVVDIATPTAALSAMTEDDGRVLFERAAAAGSTLRATANDPAGGASTSAVVTVGQESKLVLANGHRLKVDAKGFGGAQVTVAGSSYRQRRHVQSGAGAAVFGGLTTGEYRVSIVGDHGYGDSTVQIPGGDAVAPSMNRWSSVRGRVVRADGTPAPGMTVVVFNARGYSPDTDPVLSGNGNGIITAEDGTFTVPRCFPGETRIQFFGEGAATLFHTVSLEELAQEDVGDLRVPGGV